MRLGAEPVGRWGLAVLAVTGVVGVVLAVHGWSARSAGLPHASIGTNGSSRTPQAGSSSSSTPAAEGPSVPNRPLLSKQAYASVAFQVWPGTVSSAAKAAEIGLVVKVSKQSSGIRVAAGAAGQPLPAATFYPNGTKVYVIEASLGDDSGNSDYNLGDDGLVVTDAQGRILQ